MIRFFKLHTGMLPLQSLILSDGRLGTVVSAKRSLIVGKIWRVIWLELV